MCIVLLLSSIITMMAIQSPPVLLSQNRQADHILITKHTHTLTLFSNGNILGTYKVALGRSAGPKQQAGDHRTPEGQYMVDAHNRDSRFHRALHLSYPNANDRMRAARTHTKTGGDIMIHGLLPAFAIFGTLQHTADWTDGCIAVSNAEMDTIFRLVPDGTPVDIEP